MTFEKDIKKHIIEICNNLGYKYIDASIHGYKNKQNIKIVADTETGITLEECKKLSQEVSDIIFRKDLLSSDYRLDVSSPGLDKPLEYEYEFKRNIGRNLSLIFLDQKQNKKEIIGKLLEFSKKEIIIDFKGEKISIDPKNLIKANIKLQW